MKVLCVLLTLYFLGIFGNPIYIEVYRCENESSATCNLKDLLIEDGGRFMPKSKYPKSVTRVTFESSTVPTLTSDICNTFPNLQVLEIKGVSLKKIEKGALNNCEELNEIHLQDNLLKELEKDVFSQNFYLNKIFLTGNKFKSIPKDLFQGLENLQTIDLCANQLTELPAETFTGLQSMKELHVAHNPLLSLDVEGFQNQMQNLRYFWFRDLDLSCDRLEEIKEFCEKHKIKVAYGEEYGEHHSKSFESYKRTRSYSVSSLQIDYYESWTCLTNEQHDREVLLRDTLPKMMGTTDWKNMELEMQHKFNALNTEYDKKVEEIKNKTEEVDSTYLKKIFDAQTLMLQLMKDRLDAQDAKIEGIVADYIPKYDPNKVISDLKEWNSQFNKDVEINSK